MSGLNANGYAESRRLLLGLGDIYINNVWAGNLKEAVTLNITRNYAFQRAGNNIADQKGETMSEEVILTASICDLKLSQLRRAFGIDEAVDTSTAKTIRTRETLQLTDQDTVALAETITANSEVSALDRSQVFVSGVDYTIVASAIARITSAGITNGANVIVEYDFSDAGAASLAFGGETKAPNTFELIFTHRDSTGKVWQVTFFKAQTNTDFSIAFNERESGDYTVHNISFKALVDTTKLEGKNLFEIVQEDA